MNKDILLLYNPKAGDTFFRFELENFVEAFSGAGSTVRIFKSRLPGDMGECIRSTNLSEIDLTVVAGGDGSVSDVVQAMMESDVRPTLGVIPAGTSNEVAKYLQMPERYDHCIEVLYRRHAEQLNVGEVNGRFFLNRCGFGDMMEIFQKTNQELKNTFGKTAYYFKALSYLSKTKPFTVKIEANGETVKEELVTFFVVNGESNRTKHGDFIAEPTGRDEKLRFVGIKKKSALGNRWRLMRTIRHIPTNGRNILIIESNQFRISSDGAEDNPRCCYVDGEAGPGLPLEFKLHHGAMNVLTNQECSTWNSDAQNAQEPTQEPKQEPKQEPTQEAAQEAKQEQE